MCQAVTCCFEFGFTGEAVNDIMFECVAMQRDSLSMDEESVELRNASAQNGAEKKGAST